jgi:transcriptional regulator with XRE-family HTH domain
MLPVLRECPPFLDAHRRQWRCSFLIACVYRPPRLIATLLAFAESHALSLSDVADRLGVDATTLMQYRSGRRRLSMPAFANLVRVFGDDASIREAAWHYARAEYHPPRPDTPDAAAMSLPNPVVEILRTYIERLPDEAVTTGRGLYLFSTATRSLLAAAQFLLRSFEKRRVAVCHLRADANPTAADRRFALAAPVLLVERVDVVAEGVLTLIRERAELVRPIIVTSIVPPDETKDAHLRRILLSMTRLVPIASTPSTHARPAVPSADQRAASAA